VTDLLVLEMRVTERLGSRYSNGKKHSLEARPDEFAERSRGTERRCGPLSLRRMERSASAIVRDGLRGIRLVRAVRRTNSCIRHPRDGNIKESVNRNAITAPGAPEQSQHSKDRSYGTADPVTQNSRWFAGTQASDNAGAGHFYLVKF
jgi:hypothetical protein